MESNLDNVYEDMQMGAQENNPVASASDDVCTQVTTQEVPSSLVQERSLREKLTAFHKKTWSKSTFTLISVAVLVSILALSLVAVIVYRPIASSSSEEIAQLQASFRRLEIQVNLSQVENLSIRNSLNQLQVEKEIIQEEVRNKTLANSSSEEITQLQASFRRLEIQVNLSQVENLSIRRSLNHLQVEKEIIQEEAQNKTLQLGMLFRQVNTVFANISGKLEMLYMDFNVTYGEQVLLELDDIESDINQLEDKINSPVNLYENCIQVIESCNSEFGLTNVTQCYTPYIAMNVTVSACKIES